ncbi:MAG: fumarylacetoacetate hydrolase family protein [Candidatus Asgardarchaeia archaeon]
MNIILPFAGGKIELFPSKIICLMRNYSDHAREMGTTVPNEPIFFLKPSTALITPPMKIRIPPMTKEVQHEIELAVIIKKSGKDIKEEDAMNFVLGYTILLDITARDLQREAKSKGWPWTISKGFDTFAPIGPRIVASEEIINPHNLEMVLKVNNEVRQKSNTRNMVHTIPEIISYVSRVMSLEPHDIIATGTPAGVGLIRPGDVIEAWIEKIGTLKVEVTKPKLL